jgi:hypothetical protein
MEGSCLAGLRTTPRHDCFCCPDGLIGWSCHTPCAQQRRYVRHQAYYLPGVVFPGLRSAPTGSAGSQPQRPGTFLLSDFLVQNMPLRPVFVLGGAKANFLPVQLDDPTINAHSVYAWPEGLSEALYNGTLHPSVDALYKYHAAIVNRLSITPNRFKPSETEASWEWLALDAFWNCHYRMAWHMINYGIRQAGEHKYIVESDEQTGDVKQEQVDTDSQSKRAFRLAMEIYEVRPPRCVVCGCEACMGLPNNIALQHDGRCSAVSCAMKANRVQNAERHADTYARLRCRRWRRRTGGRPCCLRKSAPNTTSASTDTSTKCVHCTAPARCLARCALCVCALRVGAGGV